jgi:hypothetical protein
MAETITWKTKGKAKRRAAHKNQRRERATIISLEPCALNADFEHFIPKYNEIFLLYKYLWKKGLGSKEAQRQGDFTNNFSYLQLHSPKHLHEV